MPLGNQQWISKKDVHSTTSFTSVGGKFANTDKLFDVS